MLLDASRRSLMSWRIFLCPPLGGVDAQRGTVGVGAEAAAEIQRGGAQLDSGRAAAVERLE